MDRNQKRISDLQKKLREKELEIKNLKRQITLSSNETIGELSETHEKIFDYIKENNKIIKQRVVQWCEKKQIASRVTVLNAIKELEQYGMIVVSTDRMHGANKQKHILFVNDNSLLIEVIDILDEFEKRYITLLEEIPRAASVKIRRQSRDIVDDDYTSLISSTIKMHQHLLNVFIIYSMLVWPPKVKDEVMLAKLNVIFLNRMLNIQKKISEKLHLSGRLPLLGRGTMGDVFGPLATNIKQYFTLDLPEHENIISNSKKFNLGTEVESVLDTVWKFSYKISPSIVYDNGYIRMTDFETAHEGSLKDRKTALMIWKEQRRREGKTKKTNIDNFMSLGYR
jgi:hypothetical protein